ncbi:hypothetical protein [Pararhizobium sp. A13]|uniref:hypothetical protein n=1 Tax=Pararhizobium sp. A13 TaxID=3133975 RepID=UPI0032459645
MQKQVIEFNGEPVGAVVPDGDRFRFIAVKYGVWSLDGRLFSLPIEAKQAVTKLLTKSGGRAMPSAGLSGERSPSGSRFGWEVASPVPVSEETLG